MQDKPIPITVTNLSGDVLISRVGLPAVFVTRNSDQVIIRDRVAIALIAMLLNAGADFEQIKAPPKGLNFVLALRTPSGLRTAYIQADRVEPTHGAWLMANFDLIVVGTKVHILHIGGSVLMLASSIKLADRS